jgi:hypothetical protein
MMNLFHALHANAPHKVMQITWFNSDFYTLLFRLTVNIIFLTIVIRGLYYPKTKRKDYLFTYYLIGLITFFLCFSLKKLDIDTGMGLGLFAIFGIIRYRTDAIEIKEMTYLFLIIGVSVVNALASNKVSVAEMALINCAVVVVTYGLENIWLLKHETRKTVTYDRIDLIQPSQYDEMKKDLETRTGLTISRFEIGKIDFLRDICLVYIFYYNSDQVVSDYHGGEIE